MNKEIYHQGWLVKSPPTKRIWKGGWRRRWFTLKQGEIPEQFCLEYYTDRNCRKLKGVIDLDQCEQVDSGLLLEYRNQKFQHMFGVKTPNRTYYLAADSQKEMNDWVNCICQVCNLQDLSKQGNDRSYYNISSDSLLQQTVSSPNDKFAQSKQLLSENRDTLEDNVLSPLSAGSTSSTDITTTGGKIIDSKESYYNLSAIEVAKQITPTKSVGMVTSTNSSNTETVRSGGAIRKIPENLKLTDHLDDSNQVIGDVSEPSPALSTSSGPYILISECFSGGRPLSNSDNPTTPLNTLDPRFYDTPTRTHMNIGLNLTNEQPYSPKRNNCFPMATQSHSQPTSLPTKSVSGRSSPTDSENVFTDDEDWVSHAIPVKDTLERHLRPSDSSIENESVIFTYAQRFSKMPENNAVNQIESHTIDLSKPVHMPPLKEVHQHSSDTDNASPAIGPHDVSSSVEDSYDIPRSHNLPYYNLGYQNNNVDQVVDPTSPTLTVQSIRLTASTPNISPEFTSLKPSNRSHYYTNAAPTKIEGNVFRYDFVEQTDAPQVNRKLKPAKSKQVDDKTPTSTIDDTVDESKDKFQLAHPPPVINRKLKPKFDTNSLRRKATGTTCESHYEQHQGFSKTLPRTHGGSNTVHPKTPQLSSFSSSHTLRSNFMRNDPVLNYFDLDRSNPPPICQNNGNNNNNTLINHYSNSNNNNNNSSLPTGYQPMSTITNISNTSENASSSSTATGTHLSGPSGNEHTVSTVNNKGIVYKHVDFLKTEAFNRTRQDAELKRAQTHST